MNVQQIIKKQGWKKQKLRGDLFYGFDKDDNALKIVFVKDSNEKKIEELKNKLWNSYYSRILIYKDSRNRYKIWWNNQNKSKDRDFDEKGFDEKTSPV